MPLSWLATSQMKRKRQAGNALVRTAMPLESPARNCSSGDHEVHSFGGDPRKYPWFIKSFKTNVERTIKEDDERLSIIIVHAFIDKVVKGPQIRASESNKLSQLAREVKSCAFISDNNEVP